MFYRIRISLAYLADTNPKAIMAHTKALVAGAIIVNPGLPNEELSFITLEKCYHDEDPTGPCQIIEIWP